MSEGASVNSVADIAPAIFAYIMRGRKLRASDLYVIENAKAWYQIDGDVVPAEDGASVSPAEVRAFIEEYASEYAKRRLREYGDCEAALEERDCFGRLRLHFHRERNGITITMRFLSDRTPSLTELQLPEILLEFAKRPTGLVILTGPTGSGKTTASTAMLEWINENQSRRILTLEDPVEYIIRSKKSLVSQSEIGVDIHSFPDGIRGAMRAAPGVIVIGEMRDPETMDTALTAAETGHLVFATLHTAETAHVGDRIAGCFESGRRDLIRMQLAQCLIGVVGLRLVKRADGKGRRAATEVLVATSGIRSLIKQGKTDGIRSAISTGKVHGMHTLEKSLQNLVESKEVTLEEARRLAEYPEELEPTRLRVS